MPRVSLCRSTILLLCIGSLLSLIVPGLSPAAEKRPVVVASTTQLADFARQIGGDQVDVRSILAPGADPHTYLPTPRDVETVLSADLCLENGLHLEGKNWMGTLARDAGKPLLTATAAVTPLTIDGGGEPIPDPHAWLSAPNAAAYVNTILAGLIDIDPQRRALYESRAKLYLQQLRVLDAWIRFQVGQIPPDQRVLVTTHDAFNYFCREYRFNPDNDYLSIAPVGWSTGGEVGAGITPERRRQVVESIRRSGTKAIFVETTVNPKQVREIATETGIVIGGELYSDSMGPAGSAGETYIGMMRENVLMIVEALK